METTLEVNTNASACGLHQNEKDYCESNKVKIGSKNTIVECTKKVGFLTGPCVKLSSPKHCVNELNESLIAEEGAIDVKKQYTHEKGNRS